MFLSLVVLCPATLLASGASTTVNGVEIAGNVAFFTTSTSMCRTDGTRAGTRCFEVAKGLYDRPALLNGILYSFAGRSKPSLYAFDGENPPRETIQFDPDNEVHALWSNGKYLLFLTGAPFLMRSDGTEAGTSAVANFCLDHVEVEALAGDSILFRVRPWNTGVLEVWSSNGLPDGTAPLLPWRVTLLASLGRVVLFRDGNDLWRTDGTKAGTFLLANGVIPAALTVRDGFAYFTFKREVWRTDGTMAMPLRKVDFDPVVTGVAGRRLLFLERQPKGIAIWSAHEAYGIPAMLALVPNVNATPSIAHAGSLAYFSLDRQTSRELWRSDGTEDGTFRVATFSRPGDFHSLTSLGREKAVLFASDDLHGTEPWATDGTEDGTFLLANLTAEGVIRGRVTDSRTGLPVEGAVVSGAGLGTSVPAVRTDTDGRYALFGVIGGYTVKAQSDYYRPLEHVADVEGYEEVTLDFALRRGARIAGRVADPSGKPLAGIELELFSGVGIPARLITDVRGRFEHGPIWTETPWRLEAKTQSTYNSVTLEGIRLTPGDTHQVELTMRPMGRVRTPFIDALTRGPLRSNYLPIVKATAPGGRVYEKGFMDGASGIELALPDGDYELTARGGPYRTAAPVPVHVTAETTQTVELALQPDGASIRGVVVDAETGARISNFFVRAERISDGLLFHAATIGGNFETEPRLPDGRYRITTLNGTSTPYLPAVVETEVRFAENPRPEVVIRMTRGGTISGRVADAEGRPLKSVRLAIGPDIVRLTDFRGSYAITGLPTGTYTIVATLSGYNEARGDAIAVTAGGKTKLDLTMTRP